MTVYRITAKWDGWPGAPGYTNFHFLTATSGPDAVNAAARVRSFFEAAKGSIPSTITITYQPEVTTFNEATGAVVSLSALDSVPVATQGGASGSFPGPAGGVISWRTATPAGRRLVRGRTFVVPLSNAAFESNGTLTPPTITNLRNAAAALLAPEGPVFVVWKRPVNYQGGLLAPVTGYTVPDMAAVLRSRRD